MIVVKVALPVFNQLTIFGRFAHCSSVHKVSHCINLPFNLNFLPLRLKIKKYIAIFYIV